MKVPKTSDNQYAPSTGGWAIVPASEGVATSIAALEGPWVATLSGSDGYLHDDVSEAIEADHVDIAVVRGSAAPTPDECCDGALRMPGTYRPIDVLYRVEDHDLGEDEDIRIRWTQAQAVAALLNLQDVPQRVVVQAEISDDHPHAELIRALRSLADVLAEHPEMPMTRYLRISGCMTRFVAPDVVDEGASLERLHQVARVFGVQVEARLSSSTGCWHHTVTVPGSVKIALSHVSDPAPTCGHCGRQGGAS